MSRIVGYIVLAGSVPLWQSKAGGIYYAGRTVTTYPTLAIAKNFARKAAAHGFVQVRVKHLVRP